MSENVKSISILLPNLKGGGAERLHLTLAKHFLEQGKDVEFVLMKAEGELLDEARSLFSVYALNADRVRNVPSKLSAYLKGRRPDVLLAAIWSLTGAASIGNLLSGHVSKLFLSEHNPISVQYANLSQRRSFFLKLMMRLAFEFADGVIAVSNGVAEDLVKLTGFSRNKISVIYNPIPPLQRLVSEDIDCVNALWRDAKYRILMVGSFKQQKNHELVIRALSRFSLDENVYLMLLGEGPLRDKLISVNEEEGVSDRVIIQGFVSDPTPFYATADLFVLSSNYEGFGNVIVEALASGTPVVSTDCPSGPREILVDGKYGTLVPMGDVEALANAMRESLNSEHDPGLLKSRAKDFSPEKIANQYIELFESS